MAAKSKAKKKSQSRPDIGGVRAERPFQISRLGHFGFHYEKMNDCLDFMCDCLGFVPSDRLGIGEVLGLKARDVGKDNMEVIFLRHNTDHHSIGAFPMNTMKIAFGIEDGPLDSVNQITWQVGSLKQVLDAEKWMALPKNDIRRRGRDMPGSNWHIYSYDPEHTVNELYYGMEQIGWNGHSKPLSMYDDRYIFRMPRLPQISEYQEVQDAMRKRLDVRQGFRPKPNPKLKPKYNVGGVRLPQPFKVTRIGPVRIFVDDMESSLAYYRDTLGLRVTEEVKYNRHRCVFLRANTEHHSLALYPLALREELGLSAHTRLFSFGVQVPEYSQLRDAVPFLKSMGVEIRYLPPELSAGIDYAAYAIDPDGHAVQLYYHMEQVGWDGRPMPARLRRKVFPGRWPKLIDSMPDSYQSEPFLGPLG